jgi:hypothetical protein
MSASIGGGPRAAGPPPARARHSSAASTSSSAARTWGPAGRGGAARGRQQAGPTSLPTTSPTPPSLPPPPRLPPGAAAAPGSRPHLSREEPQQEHCHGHAATVPGVFPRCHVRERRPERRRRPRAPRHEPPPVVARAAERELAAAVVADARERARRQLLAVREAVEQPADGGAPLRGGSALEARRGLAAHGGEVQGPRHGHRHVGREPGRR